MKVISLKFPWYKPATSQQQKIFIVFVLSLLLLAWVVYAHSFDPPVFPFDDSYIYLHNAQVLHTGYDKNYLHISALTGSTSPIYLVIVTLLLFILSPLWALQTAAWLGILCYVLGLIKLAFNCSASILQTMGFLLAGLTVSSVSFHLLNGLETGWALAAMVWLLAFAMHSHYRIVKNLLAGLLPFFRPELIIFSILFLIWEAYQYKQLSLSLYQAIIKWFTDVAIVITAALPWLIWLWLSTDTIVPSSLLAKQAFYAEHTYNLSLKIFYFTPALLGFIQNIGFFNFTGMLVLAFLTPNGRWALITLTGFLIINFVYMPGTSGANNARYLQIYIPILLFFLITTIQHQQPIIRYSANILLAVLVISSLNYFPNHWQSYTQNAQAETKRLSNMADWCLRHLPANATLLINDAGYIAFATPFHLIDLVGIKSPDNINYYQQQKTFDQKIKHANAIADIIRDKHPQYLVIFPSTEQTLELVQRLPALGWHLQLLYGTAGNYYIYQILKL